MKKIASVLAIATILAASAEARKIGMHEEKLRDWALDYIKRRQNTDEKK